MTEPTMTEAQQAEREERFRYVDLSHPLMQVLFQMQLNINLPQEPES